MIGIVRTIGGGLGRRWLSTLKYPFPEVHLKVPEGLSPEEAKSKIKVVKFIKPHEFKSMEGVTSEKLEEFNKSHKTTLELNGKKLEFINYDRASKVAVDSKGKTIVRLSEEAGRDPSVTGVVSEYISSGYDYHLKSTEKRKPQPEIFLDGVPEPEYAVELAHSRCYTRELANCRANVATPEFMENQCRNIADECKIQLTVLQQDQLEKAGFRLMSAVGRASINKPRLVNLSYYGKGKDTASCHAFVGKGLCFDSGGLNIKVNNNMMGMHLDKHGAVSVMSAIRSIARLNLPINITASMGFVENSINENAYRPGDIIESRKGLTVEIGNTDAEGRLVLADVMHWTQERYRPHSLIQLSTLTGAIIVALGNSSAGLFSNSSELTEILQQAGKRSRDNIWHLPILDEHRDLVKPKTADLTNSSGKPVAGSAQAAAFLESFVESGVKWAHVDIAGAAMDPSYTSTGFGSRLLIEYAKMQSQLLKQ